jgi:hypothetical protein
LLFCSNSDPADGTLYSEKITRMNGGIIGYLTILHQLQILICIEIFDMMTTFGKPVRTGEGVVVTFHKILSWHSSGGTEESYEELL